jgi:hypothetical protein
VKDLLHLPFDTGATRRSTRTSAPALPKLKLLTAVVGKSGSGFNVGSIFTAQKVLRKMTESA